MQPHRFPGQENTYKTDFSYASPEDGLLKRMIIRIVENLTGKQILQKHHDALYAEGHSSQEVWGKALEKLNIALDYNEHQIDKFPKTGPAIFLANHPFGVVDGLVLCHLVTRVRKDFFLLVNEVLVHEPLVEGHLLPIDFRNSREAIKTNLKTKAEATNRLSRGEALAIFPSGAVATASTWFGAAQEFPWGKFICSSIHRSQCTVVPLYFQGQNSRLFQIVSQLSMNLRLGLLLHEIMNKRGKTLRIEIGDPIPYSELKRYSNRQQLIDFLREETLDLGRINNG